jgi:hypothetical protein
MPERLTSTTDLALAAFDQHQLELAGVGARVIARRTHACGRRASVLEMDAVRQARIAGRSIPRQTPLLLVEPLARDSERARARVARISAKAPKLEARPGEGPKSGGAPARFLNHAYVTSLPGRQLELGCAPGVRVPCWVPLHAAACMPLQATRRKFASLLGVLLPFVISRSPVRFRPSAPPFMCIHTKRCQISRGRHMRITPARNRTESRPPRAAS